MKKFLSYFLIGIASLCLPHLGMSQAYTITNSALDVGNPGGLRTVGDFTTTGGTQILNGGTGSTTINTWSAATAIPFAFNFYGSAVTHFIVSKNGLISFDTTNANMSVGAALNINTGLPNAALPPNTIAAFWEDTSNTSISTSDYVYTHIYGTAPNRQFWIHYYSFEIGTQSFWYSATVLEETSNKIYVVDMGYASSPTSFTGTVGIQINSTTAYEVTNPLNGLSGSPNIQNGTGGSGYLDNEYYEFTYLAPGACVPPTNQGVNNLTATGAHLTWDFGTGTSSLVEYGPSGFTPGSGTTMHALADSLVVAGLSANTMYDWYVKDSCVSNTSTWVGPHTFLTPCSTTMSGTYTLDGGSPTAGTNFNTLADLEIKLGVCGVSGPVTINVVEGTYNGQLSLGAIPGGSSTNTVTIQAAASNTNPAIFTYSASSSADNYVLKLTGTSYLTVKGLTMTATGASNGRVIELYENCSFVTIQDNILNGVATTTTSNFMAVIYNGTNILDTISNMTIRGNEINNGSYGVYIYGNSGNYAMNNTIDSNLILDFLYVGVYSYYQENNSIVGNTIVQQNTSPYSTGYGIQNYYGDFTTVVGNSIELYATSSQYGIYNYYNDASALTPNVVANNMIACIGNSGTTYGIYAYNNYYTDIVYNSINLTGGSSTAGRGIYLNSSSSGTYGFVNLKNNNLVNTGGGYAFEVSSGAVSLGYVTSSDYNNVYATGATTARINNSNYADLAAYQLAVPTMDQNSVSVDPLFHTPSNLHALATGINNVGSPYAGISVDIDGQARSATPDIGADEFSPPLCSPSSTFTTLATFSDSATIAWMAGDGTSHNVQYGVTGFSIGTGTVVSGITDTTTTLTGLSSNTTYDYYVQDDCGVNGTSLWLGPISFTTNCSPFMAPFSEPFDSSSFSNCYSQYATTGGPWAIGNGSGFNSVTCAAASDHTGNSGNFVWMDQSSNDAAVVLELNDIDVSGLTTPALSFYYWMCGVNYSPPNLTIVETWDGSIWNILDSIDIATNGWQNMLYDLTSHTHGSSLVRIRFRAESGGHSSDFYGDNAIDDIAVDEYNTLLCAAPQVAPYVENFDANTTPTCWSQSATSGGPWNFSTGSGVNTSNCAGPSDHTGNAGYFAWMDQSSSDAGVILQMPVVDISALTVPYLDFYYWMCGVGYTPTNKTYIEAFDGTNWNLFDSITTATNGWENKGFILTSAVYNTSLVQLRFRAESGGASLDFYGDNVIDDVSIIEAPSCFLPSALGATNVGTTTADIYWTTGGATNWNVEYGIVGFTPGTGTMMASTNDTLSLTGLSNSSIYEFYVQDSCGVADVSAWAGPFSFVTLCGVILPPSMEDFNNGFPANCWEEADGGTPLTGPTTLGTGAWGDDGFGNVGTSGAPRINLWNTGDEDWVLSPFYDLSGGNWSAEFDFGVFLYANTGVGTLGSDDQVQFLISLDTGATWTMLALFDSSYVTAPGGNHESISLSAYTGSVVMFAMWATEGTVDDPEDNDIFFDNFAIVDPCATIMAPYVENFDVNATPACWSQSATTGGPWAFSTGSGVNTVTCSGPSDHTGNSGYFAWMDHSGGDAGVILEMPMINVSALTVPYLDFYYWMCGSGYTPINPLYIETFDGTNWTVFDSIVQGTAGWEEFGFDLTSVVYNTDKVKVRFRTESGGSGVDFYGDPVLDDIGIIEAPSCFAPTALGVANVGTTTTDLYWTTGGAANWNVEYGTAGFTPGTGTMVNSTNDTLGISSLTAAMAYEFYVRDSCAVGDVSVWVGPFAFSTAVCPPANACTYTAELRDTYGDAWNGGEVTVWQNGIAVQVLTYPVINGGQNDTLLVVPVQICDSLNTVVTISALGSFSSEIGVRLMTPLSTVAGNHTATGGLSAGDTLFSFMSSCVQPACAAPSALGATSITSSSASIFWMSGGAANWNVQYDTTGFALGMGMMVSATNDTISLSGLMANTTYQFYVQDSCGVGNVSSWTGPFSFTTNCVTATLPFVETSEPGTSTTLGCWSVQTGWALSLNGGYGNSATSFIFPFYSLGTGSSAFSPQFTSVPAGYQLSFDHAYATYTGGEVDSLEVFYSTDSGATYTLLTVLAGGATGPLATAAPTSSSFVPTSSQWASYSISLPAGVNKLRFDAISDFGNNLYLDNISVALPPACPAPSALGSFNLAQTSADIYWTKGSVGATSIVEYGPTGFTPGTGTLVIATNDTITLTGLTASTMYDFCVTDSCGVGNVSTTFCSSFTTSCGALVAPFFESFDGTTLPLCWSDTAITGGPWVFGGAGTNSVNCAPATDHTGNSGNYAWMDQSGSDAGVVMETPVVDVSALTVPTLDFFYWMCGSGYTPINKTFLEYWSGSAWVVFDSLVNATTGWEYQDYSLVGRTYSTGLVKIRFRAESGGSGSDFYGDNAIDDVSIRELPLCLDPSGLMANGATLNSVSLSWASDTGITASVIEYGPTGFTPGTGTYVAAMPNGGTVTGLSAGTCYDFYATDSCGTSVLAWLGPINVCTMAPCTVTGMPTGVMGDTTGCGGGAVTLTTSSTGNIAWLRGTEVVGSGSSHVDSVNFTTTFNAVNYNTAGPGVHVGPTPTALAGGFGNFNNGQWITVMDTIVLDSFTVRSNGFVRAEMMVWDADTAIDRPIQRSPMFTTPATGTVSTQIYTGGMVFTPGSYYVNVVFDSAAVGSALYRATGGAVFPYVAPGLMSIDSVNFNGGQIRYYYLFDMVIKGACLSTGVPALAYVPGSNAGMDDSTAVCILDTAVDLSSYLGLHDAGGTWSDDDATGALTGSTFDPSATSVGTYHFTYKLSGVGGCAADSATVTVTVVGGGNAGPDSTGMACTTGPNLPLKPYFSGSPGGTYVNLDGATIPSTTLFRLDLGATGPGTYRFLYTLPAGICPADTAMVTITIDPAADAGGNVMDTICDSSTVNLNTLLGANAAMGGTWKDINGTGALSGSIFDVTAVAPGNTYTFRYVVSNTCGMDSAEVSVYVCPIGLGEFTVGGLNIYPNPTSNLLNIENLSNDKSEMEVELFDFSGKLIYRNMYKANDKVILEMNHLPDGVYNVKVKMNGTMSVHRVTKQ